MTINEIAAIPKDEDVKMYKGVGKMYVPRDHPCAPSSEYAHPWRCFRFVQVPRATMEKQLKSQEKESIEEINVLQKKVKYLEKQFADSQNQLRDIVSSNAQLNVDLHGSSLVYSFMLNRGRRGTLLTNAPRPYLCITGLTKTPVTSIHYIVILALNEACGSS